MCAKPPPASPSRDNGLAKFLSGKPARAIVRRLALWEIDGAMQCSIIGTCLTDQDLVAALRREKLQAASHANSYDIHSFCVRAAGNDTPLARSLSKLLDRRFEGALRLVARTDDAAALRDIWTRLRDSGQIGAGYWALLSHTHVPSELKVSIFGEVHMLSHLNGHGAQELTLRLSEAQQRIAELEGRLRRSEQAKLEAVRARDAALQAFSSARGNALAPAAERVMDDGLKVTQVLLRLAKVERALISARARARLAEQTLTRPQAGEDMSRRVRQPLQPEAAATALPQAQNAASQRLRILYLGGRPALLPHLRVAAQVRQADLLHHDGGVDDNMHRIEELIHSCDVVMCPIDCVSHGACRMAKETCQRLRKRFVPIATSSRSGFERALEGLA